MTESAASVEAPQTSVASIATSGRVRILLLLMALCFISHFNRISITIAADERIMSQYGVSPEQMGRIYTAFLLVYTVFMMLGGYFIDRAGVRMALFVMAVGSGALAAATGLLGLTLTLASQFLVALFIVRSTMGLVTTPLHPASAKAVSIWFPPAQRTWANGLVTGAALLGVAFTYHLFGRLMDWVDWPGAFLIAGIITILIGLAWAVFAKDAPASPQLDATLESSHRPMSLFATSLPLLRNRNLVWLTIGYAAVGYFQYVFFYWSHFYFDSELNLGKEQSRWFSTIPVLAMAVCMPLGGWLSDQMERRYGRAHGRKIIPVAGMVLGALFLCFGLVSTQPSLILTCFSLSLGAVGAAEGPFWRTAVEIGGVHGGTAAAIINIGGNGVGLLAPYFTPVVSAAIGWKWGISIAALAAISGALCWIPIRTAALEQNHNDS